MEGREAARPGRNRQRFSARRHFGEGQGIARYAGDFKCVTIALPTAVTRHYSIRRPRRPDDKGGAGRGAPTPPRCWARRRIRAARSADWRTVPPLRRRPCETRAAPAQEVAGSSRGRAHGRVQRASYTPARSNSMAVPPPTSETASPRSATTRPIRTGGAARRSSTRCAAARSLPGNPGRPACPGPPLTDHYGTHSCEPGAGRHEVRAQASAATTPTPTSRQLSLVAGIPGHKIESTQGLTLYNRVTPQRA